MSEQWQWLLEPLPGATHPAINVRHASDHSGFVDLHFQVRKQPGDTPLVRLFRDDKRIVAEPLVQKLTLALQKSDSYRQLYALRTERQSAEKEIALLKAKAAELEARKRTIALEAGSRLVERIAEADAELVKLNDSRVAKESALRSTDGIFKELSEAAQKEFAQLRTDCLTETRQEVLKAFKEQSKSVCDALAGSLLELVQLHNACSAALHPEQFAHYCKPLFDSVTPGPEPSKNGDGKRSTKGKAAEKELATVQ